MLSLSSSKHTKSVNLCRCVLLRGTVVLRREDDLQTGKMSNRGGVSQRAAAALGDRFWSAMCLFLYTVSCWDRKGNN